MKKLLSILSIISISFLAYSQRGTLGNPSVVSSAGGSGGLSSNEVYAIALSVGGPTNGISAATATNIVNNNNAATATWSTNLVFPGGYSEILVADAALTTKAVSYDDFKFFSGSGESRMELGTVGSTGSGGRIRIHDVLDQQDVDIRVTNSTIFFPNGITLQDAVQSYSLVNGVKLPLFKGENHNSVENVGYFTGDTWDAVAFQVGHSGRAQATNGQRFSFLIGETDHSWNLIQFTNTTISRWTAGTSGPQQKNVISYNSGNETYEFGTNVRSAILSGTNLTLTGKTNISFAGSDGVMRLNTDGLSVGDTGKGGRLRLWDDIQSQWISAYAEDDVVIFDKAFAAPSGTFTTHLTVSQTNVLGLNGSLINAVGITNGNVSIPGTLGVTGATTMGALYGTTISGNGGGITNVPASAITGTYADITTTNLSALSGMLRLVTGSGTGTTNTWRLFSDGDAISMDFLETSAGSPSGYIFDRVFNSDGNFTWAGSIIATNAIVTLDEFHGDGGGISNLNAAYISGDLSVSNLTATTLIADTFVGNGSGLTNLSGNGYRVKSFGAVGNGATDDTSAFEQTIATAATNTVKLVLVEPGRYVIKRPLYLPSNVTLQGFGASTVITKPTSVKCFVTNTVSAGAISVTLSNVSGFAVNDSIYLADTTSFEWLSTKAVITNISGNTISFNVPVVGSLQTARAGYVSTSFPLIRNLSDGTTNIVVTDIVLDQNSSTNDPANEFTVAAVHWQGTFYSTVRQSWLLNACGDAYSDQATNGLDITPSTNYIRKCHNAIESTVIRNAGRHGVHLGTCIEGGRVIGNTITKCGGFAYFYCAFTTYTVASGNLVDECLSGFAGIDQRDYGNTISGNTIKGCTNYSIDLASGGGDGTGGRCSIIGNTVFGRPIYSVQPECTFIGNVIHSGTSTDGIRLGATADRSVVSGNTIYSGGGAGSSVMEIISADDVRIVGNIFNGSSKGINVQGCTRLVATGNTLTGMTSTFWLFNGAASTNIIINNELTTATTPVSESTAAVRLVYQGYGDNGTNDPAISGWWTNSDSRMWNGTMVIWTNASTTNVSMFIKGVGWRKLDP